MIWRTLLAFNFAWLTPVFATCADQLVLQPVAGLYDSIPSQTNFAVGELCFSTSVNTSRRTDRTDHTEIFFTQVKSGSGERVAAAERSFSADRLEMQLGLVTRLDTTGLRESAPSFVNLPDVISLVPGRGIPTAVFLTLHQMKIAKVAYGSLRSVSTGGITNLVTALELGNRSAIREWLSMHDTFPKDLIAHDIMTTSTGRYIQTFLTQAGMRIKAVSVIDGSLVSVSQYIFPGSHPLVEQARGLVRGDEFVPYGYRLIFDLAPL